MSAYIVGKQTIDRIINGILARRKELNFVKGIPRIPFDDSTELSAFGQKLWDMNKAAVDYRYSKNNERQTYTFSGMPVTHVQALKSLRCFLYQCSEGDIIKSPLYKELYQLSLELAYAIATDSTAYDKAEWG